jgi:crotonobetainyl-CoA:carnitine CoA-transferase CaiB-like acyl-CoA transferase
MKISIMSKQINADVPMIGNPLKLSKTPVSYRNAPPTFGQHTDDVLGDDEWN